MNLNTAAALLGIIAALAVTVWGLVTTRRSALIGVIAAAVAVLAAGGVWYVWAESRSAAWTSAYAVVVIAALASAVRQLAGRRPREK